VGRVVDIQVQGLVLLLGVILDRLQDKAIQVSLALLPAKVIQAKLLLVRAIQDKLNPVKAIQDKLHPAKVIQDKLPGLKAIQANKVAIQASKVALHPQVKVIQVLAPRLLVSPCNKVVLPQGKDTPEVKVLQILRLLNGSTQWTRTGPARLTVRNSRRLWSMETGPTLARKPAE